MKQWRIYYDDKDYLEDEMPTGEAAWGVQAIVQPDSNCGWYAIAGDDYYVMRKGKWIGVDMTGLLDYLTHTTEEVHVIVGRHISNEEFQAIFKQAQEDAALANKTAFMPRRARERRP